MREELAALARDLRASLGWHRRAGAWSVPGGASPRPVAVEAAPAAGTTTPVPSALTAAAVALDDPPPALRAAVRSLAVIRDELGPCTRCKLHKTRNKIVFGVGPEPATLMFIGEGPGADEDRIGDPFVGKAGELLDKMIEAMGWQRDEVYIANIVKCRPPGNRNPEPDEIAACRPFLDAQIQAVRPRVIVTLGRPAANVVLGVDAPISTLRGRFHDHRGIRLMPTFHPAYLLRTPEKKREAWGDLKQVIAELDRLGVPAPRPPRA